MKKQTIKKTGAAVLSMAMLLSMGAVSGVVANAAADKATIAVTASQGSYKLYKVAGATVNGEVVTFSLNAKYNGILEYSGGLLKTKVTLLSGAGQLEAGTPLKNIVSRSAAAEELAMKLSAAAATDTAVDTKTAASGTTSFDVTELGYYLIIGSTNGKTQPILVYVDEFGTASTDKTYSVRVKNSDTTIDKTITAIDAKHGTDNVIGTNGKTGIVDKEAVVTYQLATAFPSYDTDVNGLTDHFTIVDIPEESIGIKMDTIAVTIGGTPYVLSNDELKTENVTDTISATATPALEMDGKGFKIVFKDETVLANGGKDVIVTFDADVTATDSKLDVNDKPNDNTVKVTYSNNYFTGKGSVTYTPDEPPTVDPDNPKVETSYARVYTTVMTVNKVDPDGAAVQEAGFTLYEGTKADVWDDAAKAVKNGAKAVAAPAASGNSHNQFVFNGLAAGQYTLVESTVPEGFVGEGPKEIIITATDADNGNDVAYAGGFTLTKDGSASAATFNIVNNPKQTLPATGGVGTVLFTVGGAAIILLAGALFIVYLKKRKVEEE